MRYLTRGEGDGFSIFHSTHVEDRGMYGGAPSRLNELRLYVIVADSSLVEMLSRRMYSDPGSGEY
jgi:hypothetical protein